MRKRHIITICIFFIAALPRCLAQEINSISMKLMMIKPGKSFMGSAGLCENFDESPSHTINVSKPFKMSATEVTNAQYELFDPEHKKLRGKLGFSNEDDDAVIFINYYEALAFCKWLSQREGKNYRLPTEAEWEYACRAGSFSDFSTGDGLPKKYLKNQETVWTPKPVSLKVGTTPANAWGLFDMHGNVEEWCYDWYGPYDPGEQSDPVGRSNGLFRVTRGGSHGTPVRYLRSANRSAMIPQDKSWLVGFRVVQASLPGSKPLAAMPLLPVMQNVKQSVYRWVKQQKPVFMEPEIYVRQPECISEVPVYAHNHCPAITWCTNGDLLAVWFSTNEESGREMAILGSRLRGGKTVWDRPSIFFKVPDRNMTGSSLLNDKEGNLYYINGVETSGSWQNLAMVFRTSKDNGANWSAPQMADAEHAMGNQVIAGMLTTKEGWLIQAGDATPSGEGGTAIHISRDKGKTWHNPSPQPAKAEFKENGSGRLIAGIHAGIVQLANGDLMALGRGNAIEGKNDQRLHMPVSVSNDMGKTWTYHASEFPPIAGGQRLILCRLNEGPILMISFTHHPTEKDPAKIGMTFKDSKGTNYTGYGMYVALSFDEGKSWPVKKLLTDGRSRILNGGAWTGFFEMDATHAEPRGYLAVTQTPDNMIHLLSSAIHYRFNLNWLKQ